MSRELRHRLFLRWSCGTLVDEQLAGCSILARHIFDRGLLMSRKSGDLGRLSARDAAAGVLDESGFTAVVLAPGMDPVTPDQVGAAFKELVAAGLLVESDRPGLFEIPSWEKHNGTGDGTDGDRDGTGGDRVRTAQRASAHRTNHRRGFHDKKQPVDCVECFPDGEFTQVGTVDNGDRVGTDTVDRDGSGDGTDGPLKESLRTSSSSRTVDGDDDDETVAAFDWVARSLAIDRANLNPTEQATIRQLVAAGITPETIGEMSDVAADKDNPRSYLRTCLKNKLAEVAAAADADHTACCNNQRMIFPVNGDPYQCPGF